MTTKELLALVAAATPGPWEWINSNTDQPFDFDAPWDGGGYPSLRTVEFFGENKTEVRDGGTYTSFALPKWILTAEPMQEGNDAANAALIVAAVNALPALCAEVEEQALRIAQQDATIARMREALEAACESVMSWGAYASPYFQEKHDLNGDIDAIRAALNQEQGK